LERPRLPGVKQSIPMLDTPLVPADTDTVFDCRPVPQLLWILALLAGSAVRAAEGNGTPVSADGLQGKVLAGYQGWFNCEGDGAQRGWFHWSKGGKALGPGAAKIDLWPDMTELGPSERFPTGFRHADGRTAEVFSSYNRQTVLRHFEWMRQYGIDGAFVQRFLVDVQGEAGRRHNDAVLDHCREGALRSGRVYSLMYDLSGLGADQIQKGIDDWKRLRSDLKLTSDPRYLRHRGKPLVTVWGVGFNDHRRYTLPECRRLVESLQSDGCAVMLGVPTYWRELKRDSVSDPALHELLRLADVISPWTVGRYRDPEQARRHGESVTGPDLAWCTAAHVDYLPVVFPGFSWHNMQGGPSDDIPRKKGQFLWSQFLAVQRAGLRSAYVAMFDEVDEGTAIFKVTGDVPVDPTATFLGLEGLPPDFYLRLTGAGGRLLRGELPPTPAVPVLTGP